MGVSKEDMTKLSKVFDLDDPKVELQKVFNYINDNKISINLPKDQTDTDL